MDAPVDDSPVDVEVNSFAELDLSDEMLSALDDAGYEKPTSIQAGLIPLALDEIDVIGQARTGTGKTAAFAIPILELLVPPRKPRVPQALILVPTRELAVQVREECAKLAKGYKEEVHCVAVYGGKPIRGQISKLQRGADVVVGTPGRVIDLTQRGALVLSDLYCVVLDEADRMLDLETLETFFLAPQPPMPVFDLPEADRRALAVFLFADEQANAGSARESP